MKSILLTLFLTPSAFVGAFFSRTAKHFGFGVLFSSTVTFAQFPTTPGIVFNTSTTASRNATPADIVGLFPGSGPCFLKNDGTCSLTVPGNLTALEFNGTADAALQPTAGSNTAIQTFLNATSGNFITVNQGYPSIEGIYNVNYRPYPFLGQVPIQAAPPFKSNTWFNDFRTGSVGPFFNNPIPTQPAYFFDIFSNDTTPTAGNGAAWAPIVNSWRIAGGGRNMSPGQTNHQFITDVLIDQSQGISTNHFFPCWKFGFGDQHCLEIDVENDGSAVSGGDEATPNMRMQNFESPFPYYSTANVPLSTATFMNVTRGSNAGNPGEEAPAVFPTLSGSQFHILSDTPPSGAIAGTWTIDATNTPDTFGTLLNAVAVPQLDNGAITAESIALTGLTAAIVASGSNPTTNTVCIADPVSPPESDTVASCTTASGTSPHITQTCTVNMQRARNAGAYIAQGAHACKGEEILANEIINGSPAPLRNMFRIIGADGAHTLRYSANMAGVWADAPDKDFSTTEITANSGLLTRASNIVTISTPGISSFFNGVCIKIANAVDSSYDGTFCNLVANASGSTLTWANTGANGTTTVPTTIQVEAPNGFDNNAAVEMPMYNIVRPNNPSTGSPDGTFVIEQNTVSVVSGVQIEVQHGNQIAGELEHSTIQRYNTASASFGNSLYNAGWSGVIPNGAAAFTVAATNQANHYEGTGGQRSPDATIIKDNTNSPIFTSWITGHGLGFNDNMFLTTDCGPFPCNSVAAFYNIFNLEGQNSNLDIQWAPSVGDLYRVSVLNNVRDVSDTQIDDISRDVSSDIAERLIVPTEIQDTVSNPSTQAIATFTPTSYTLHGSVTPVVAAFDAGSTVNGSAICTVASPCSGTVAIYGTGTGTLTLGAVGQIGTGATANCVTSHVCDSISGSITLTTGTGTLTAGQLLTITPSGTRAHFMNCVVTLTGGTTFLAPRWTTSATAITLTGGVALAASSSYNVSYVCGGD